MKLFLSTLALTGLAVLALTPAAHAQQYLVGAYLFSADPNGATANRNYQYDTDSETTASALNINNAPKSIAFALGNGSNNFTFSQTPGSPLSQGGGGAGDLGLFFSSSNTPYNPSPGTARTPDLLIARLSNGSGAFFTPIAGAAINNYAYPGGSLANGAASITLGASTITISAYSVTNTPTGTFTLLVSNPAAVPEPGGVALLIGAGVTGAGFLARRRKQARQSA